MRVLRIHSNRISAIRAEPDGERIRTASFDHTIRTWELKNKTSPPDKLKWSIHSFAISPSGRLLVVNDSEQAYILDPATFGIVCKGDSLPGCFWSDANHLFTIAGNGYRVITFDFTPPITSTVAPVSPLIKPKTPARPPLSYQASGFVKHSMRCTEIHSAFEGTEAAESRLFVAIGPETWLCRVSPAGVIMEQENLQVSGSKCVAFQPRSAALVAVAGADGQIRIINCQTRKIQKTLDLSPIQTRSMAFTPNGNRLVTSSDDGMLRFWDIDSGKELRQFVSGSKTASSLLVTADGANLVIGGSDGVVRVGPMPNLDEGSKSRP